MMLDSLSILLVLQWTTLTMGQQEECGGPLSSTLFDSIQDTCDYYCRCTFPTQKMNVSCILSSCPLLERVCPLTSNGSANSTALNNAVSILTSCLGQQGLICGVNTSHTPMVQLGWTTKDLLPSTIATGSCALNPGSGYLNNLSSAKFTALPVANSSGLITMTIETSHITNTAYFNCNFRLPSTSILQPLTTLTTLNAQNMYGMIYFNVSVTVSIDLRAQPPNVTTLDDRSNHTLVFNNFIAPNGVPLDPSIVQMFNKAINQILVFSSLVSTPTNFLSTYAALALQAAQINCPS